MRAISVSVGLVALLAYLTPAHCPAHAQGTPSPIAGGYGAAPEAGWPNSSTVIDPSTGQDPSPKPRAYPWLDDGDEIAALEAIRFALSEVGDGGSYVWYRQNGRLNGVVNPTASFKDRQGRVCRHMVLIMSAGAQTGRAEGIACRDGAGRWLLEG